jgi:hypothetical protein
MKAPLCAVAWLLLPCLLCNAQTENQQVPKLDEHALRQLSLEYGRFSERVTKQSARLVEGLQRQEALITRQIGRRDSSVAARLMSEGAGLYKKLKGNLALNPGGSALHPLKEYLPAIDSVQTALEFLHVQPLTMNDPAVADLTQEVLRIQQQLQTANVISEMLSDRQQRIKAALGKYNLSDYLSGYSQRAYYYRAQLQVYKDQLAQPDQLAGRILSMVRNSSAFQRYFRSNSYLSTLFRVPGGAADIVSPADNKLQTRDQVNGMVAKRLGKGVNFATAVNGQSSGSGAGSGTSSGSDSGNPLAGSMGQAQSAMNGVRTKIAQFGGGGSSTPMPDFQPNSEHNKMLWKRLEYGFNVQSTHTTPYLPATSDIAATIGYKVSDRMVVGVGCGFKLGWGQPFSHLSLSGQGASLRSFIDWKIKGTWWIAGGYESDYYNAFAALDQLAPIRAWQRVALIGFQKTYKVGKRTGNVQLLWNLLYQQQVPQPQPLIFRVGYTL